MEATYVSINGGTDKKKKIWYIHTTEYYSPMKRNKSVSFAETWMSQETVVQREIDKKEKNKSHILTPLCGI